MRTLWLNLSGTRESRQKTGLSRLSYPLCFNLPRSAWCIDEETAIRLFDHTVSPGLYIDLLVEIRKDLSRVNQKQAESAIAGCRWCVGVSDQWFINQVALPTVRDYATCFYYSRWPDGYNVVSPLINGNWSIINQKSFQFLNTSR